LTYQAGTSSSNTTSIGEDATPFTGTSSTSPAGSVPPTPCRLSEAGVMGLCGDGSNSNSSSSSSSSNNNSINNNNLDPQQEQQQQEQQQDKDQEVQVCAGPQQAAGDAEGSSSPAASDSTGAKPVGKYVIPQRRYWNNMVTYWWFSGGRPGNSAAAAVLALMDAGRPIVDEDLRELAANNTREELEKLAALVVADIVLECGCRVGACSGRC
jgi:hypothetical protein